MYYRQFSYCVHNQKDQKELILIRHTKKKILLGYSLQTPRIHQYLDLKNNSCVRNIHNFVEGTVNDLKLRLVFSGSFWRFLFDILFGSFFFEVYKASSTTPGDQALFCCLPSNFLYISFKSNVKKNYLEELMELLYSRGIHFSRTDSMECDVLQKMHQKNSVTHIYLFLWFLKPTSSNHCIIKTK